MAEDLDLTGKGESEPPGAEQPRKRGRPKGSTTRKPSSAKADEAAQAFKDGMVQIAGAVEDRHAEFATILKRDAPKMAQVIGHWASRIPVLYRIVVLIFGPGSVVYAIRAFGPTVLHVRGVLRERREARILEESEAGLGDAAGIPG